MFEASRNFTKVENILYCRVFYPTLLLSWALSHGAGRNIASMTKNSGVEREMLNWEKPGYSRFFKSL